MAHKYITPKEEMNKVSVEELRELFRKMNAEKKKRDKEIAKAYSEFNWNLKCGTF